MIRICMDCKKIMGEKAPYEDKRETHGLCDECLEIETKKVLDYKLKTPNSVDAWNE